MRASFSGAALACALAAGLAAPGMRAQSEGPQVVISQIHGGGGNSGATYRNDFIELFNRGTQGAGLDGWSVQYASASGTAWQVTPLVGTIEPGQYFLVRQAAGAGGTADLPAADVSGSIAMSATAGKVALVRSAGALSGVSPEPGLLADLVGYGAANLFEGAPAQQLSNTQAGLRRGGGCIDTNNNAADFQRGAPEPRNRASARRDCRAAGVPIPATLSEIQGPGSTSPYTGQLVVTRGVVTGRKSNGYFLQARETDDDSETSEGVFVFTGSAPPEVAQRGNLLEVTGTVAEFRPASDPASPTLTELIDSTAALMSEGNLLPGPVTPDLSEFSRADGLEKYEGMRVAVEWLVLTAPTGGSVREGSATATSNGIVYGVVPPLPRPYRKPGGEEGPERLRVDMRSQGGAVLDLPSRTVLRNLVGPLDYGARTYTIVLDAEAKPDIFGGMSVVALPAPAADEFTVASLNLQRFFDDQDDPSTSDAVLSPAARQTRVQRTGHTLRLAMGQPDVLAVQEVENIETLRLLAAELGGYEAHLLEGSDPSGIDVGFLVKSSRVLVRNVTQWGRDERHIAPSGASELTHDRPPLVLRAQTTDAAAVPFTVVAVHLRSLIDAGEPRVRAKREAQARSIRQLVLERQAGAPAEPLIVTGDFNAFQFADEWNDLVSVIKADTLVNLTDLLPPDQNYSYVFGGETQTLDHVLVNGAASARLTRIIYLRSNADFPETVRNFPARLERISDHDAPVAYFTTVAAGASIAPVRVLNAASRLTGAVAPGEVLVLPAVATRVFFNSVPAAILHAGADHTIAIAPFTLAGSTTEVRLEGAAGARSFLLPVVEKVPGIFTVDGSGRGQGAILNQDFTTNSAARPASRGSMIMIFGTGGGQTEPPSRDGQMAGGDPPRLSHVFVEIDGMPAEVTYAGAAPGMVAGVWQVNVRVPEGITPEAAVPVRVGIGGRWSQPGVKLAVR
ncbi:MAG: lamin tail domain-containing protein [Acidobacteria bacterium]|nr:lamin tail domain-containing protein [Acidobacteriota bacterium]